ncbi:MAG TPA: mycofactocin-associated electron transfer flavoprotein alpha subunit [Actinomycetes bacterium]|nr:mycofactocin-associated electron transfer flavoprotein alpha subunit [Actinomycetes bacterium]
MREQAVIAVVPVRAGILPLGADETVAEAGGAALVVGEDAAAAAGELTATRAPVRAAEAGPFRAGAWAAALAPLLAGEAVVVLPASPDGRDLAPRLAAALGRPLLAGAVRVEVGRVVLARHRGLVADEVAVDRPVVATLQPGVRGVEPGPAGRHPVEPLELALAGGHDAEPLELLPPDPATMDLAEAPRIVAGGQGLGGPEAFAVLGRVAQALGASLGATRVATDQGWASAERQIGTTGVTVDPRLYVGVGISGAVQHVAGLGRPDHVIAVNTDPSCPMMAMADLAVVSDAPAFVAELAARLGTAAPAGARAGGANG